jgi:hypothetical protein
VRELSELEEILEEVELSLLVRLEVGVLVGADDEGVVPPHAVRIMTNKEVNLIFLMLFFLLNLSNLIDLK